MNIDKKIDQVYQEVGEFSTYQIVIVFLVSCSAFVLSNADYSYNIFIGATPDFRCKIQGFKNDTYEIINNEHEKLINKYIPPKMSETSVREIYDTCHLKYNPNENSRDLWNFDFNDTSVFELRKCTEYVYSKLYYKTTTTSHLDGLPNETIQKIVEPYGLRYGRKSVSYAFILASSACYIILSILLNIKSINQQAQLWLFGILRVITGRVSTFYPIATVLVFGYLVREYNNLIICYTTLITIFVLYFWYIPESPRWLLLNKKTEEAIKIFEKIAKSNNKDLKECSILNELKANINESIDNKDIANAKSLSKSDSIRQFFGYFIKDKLILLRSLTLVLNWTTNNLIYYGVGLNTSDLAGNPFSNFAISISLELIAGILCQFAFTILGRKLPCILGMVVAGLALIITGFIPSNLPVLLTVLALIAKFAISFPFNGMMIITSELHPTVIRNTVVSFCTTISQIGSIIAPQLYLLGELYFFPLPFIIFGVFALISAVLIVFLVPETKGRVLPDKIEDYIQ
ncbi:unnamed protein product [Brachionus calyciflorus]|uniref:Uncharacterized protein n=1 Tax=Brachionus calyciflorus TaxID=104777 RepID=A0A814FXX8_9BILA|nr:unnamed protein product [Brachionus calyciflorus]